MNLGRRRPAGGTSSPLRVSDSRNALTAAGVVVRRRNAEMIRRLAQPWQQRAFAYYDLLGEIKYAAQFYSRSLASLELYAGEYQEFPDGRKEIVPTTDETARKLLDRIQDPGGGRSRLLSSYGRLRFLTGEAYLVCTKDPDTELEQWEMLSTSEIRPVGSSYVRQRAPSMPQEEYKETDEESFEPLDADRAVVYRLWNPHPQWSDLADSTMQGVLELAEELVLLTQAVRARTRSRMAGPGILFLDEAVSPAPLEPVGDEDPVEDPFLADIIEAATTAITDEGSAAAVSPIISRIPVPDSKSIRDVVYHLQVSDPTQLYPETGLRRECIERIAIGLDLPPEILTGIASANHWSGWMVDEQVWKAHLQPVCQQLVDDLTSSYYRPALREAGVDDWQRFCIHYDAAALINHPDRSKDAKDLHDRGAIGDAALRDAANFDDSDAQTEEERRVWISIKSRDPGFAETGIPSKSTTSGAEAEAGVIDTVDSGTSSPEAVKSPPEEPPALLGSNGAADRILGASALALHRAREVAGNRLRSLAKRDPDALTLIEGVRTGQVAAALGRERVRALKAPSERELVAGAHDLILDALRVFGLSEASASAVSNGIEEHAALTLYDEQPRPLPPSFENYLRGAVREAKA